MDETKSIPVEWIEEWCKKHDKMTLFYLMLGDWKREQRDSESSD